MKHRIVIQQHRPWQSPMLVAGGACLLAVAGWGLYSYTRASTVSDFERAQLEVEQLRDERRRLTRELRSAREEITQLKEQVVYVQRSTEIDTQACDSVRASLTDLQEEASDLREQLAFYRGIAAPEQSRAGVRVHEFKLQRTAGGGYHYDLVLIQSVRHERRVAGRVEIAFSGRQNGSERRISLDEVASGEARNLVFSLKYFEDFGGEFRLPAGFAPARVLVRLVPAAENAPAIEESFEWARVLSGGGG
ncbi:MAG TPA: DUF6776 family protein [Solimonas sp.]|nr:DUF6776 family protein [Solimonas sp.]